MDITPHVNLLKSLRGERINYPLLIGEGVDNALDAGATTVAVSIGDDEISFKDDGIGITRDRIASLFSLGDHGAMSTTQLGRFGIGIKHQAVNAGNIFRVISTSHDGRIKMSVDWKDILKNGRWHVDDPRWLPVSVGAQTGTTIEIADLRRPPKLALDKIRQEVAMQFRPAIADGKHISFNGSPINLLPDPELTDVVERQFSLSDGKIAKLRAGILVQHPSKLNRVHVAYKHRVIMPGSTLGCGEFGGLNKMFARLQLAGPWHLAKFKDDLTDEAERDELEEAVHEALRPILERCSTESMTARIAQLTKEVNDLVHPDLQPARPHQGTKPAKAQDKSAATKSGGVVDADKSDLGGPAKAKRQPHDRLTISFDGDAETDGIGSLKGGGKIKHVSLSADHPYVADLMTLRDDRLIARTILVVAMAIFEHHRTRQEDLLDPFGKRIANMLAINEPAKAVRA